VTGANGTAVTGLFGRMMWPERTPVSDLERELAATRIAHAHANGSITAEQAGERHGRLPSVRTRADLRAALHGLPGAVTPAGLLAASRLAAALWVVLSVVQFVVWALICLISGSWDGPWWLWTVFGGGALVAGLHRITEWDHRMRISEDGPSRS